MNEFYISVTIAYLYSIFLINLRMKLETKQIRFLKILLLVLTIFSVSTFFKYANTLSGWGLYTEILALITLFVFFGATYCNEIKSVYKKISSNKIDTSPRLIDNELAVALIQSVDYLSKRKIGALITVERSIRLTNIIDNALMINADVSKELLTSIFIPSTPLHDGAVIIRDNKILCAKAYFPASDRTDLPMNYGTRHRAAIGISEHSDAFTIVVSEETGRVSVTVDGKMEYNVTKEALNLYLENILKIN
ncbi:MAG: diadenylate cyclase [Candidatus Izemoplasmatales bacterium]|uniref:Diadenylate cyclase n=1 Tax=Hujiaoplasma nucleasis TaxID=2725268 RepID=A0A7L6N657_9MOLU|nr:DNA integrity scanning protein DisA nucleotide-binding domain protein [Hujiaoplasma nucleasis]QLY40485.1 TIGR00159 family protein [Hujiaoplasma nucleasis]